MTTRRRTRTPRRPRPGAFGSVGLLGLVACVVATPAGPGARPVPPEPSPRADTVRVLAYNIHHGEGQDGVLDLDRIAALIRRFEPDLVALQEVDRRVERTGGVDQAVALADRTGLDAVFGPFMPYQGGEYGMAVLLAWPVVESWNHRLPEGAEPRSSVTVRVRSPETGRELVLAGVHFYRTEEDRLAQARSLLDALADSDAPTILAGDFNSRPGSPVLELLAESFRIPSKGDDRLTFPSDAPDREIDFVMVRPAERFEIVEHRVVDEPVASDHRPVFAVLVVR